MGAPPAPSKLLLPPSKLLLPPSKLPLAEDWGEEWADSVRLRGEMANEARGVRRARSGNFVGKLVGNRVGSQKGTLGKL